MKKSYQLYFLSTLVLVLPIIIANVYYSDDINRSINGYTMWGIDGRPLSDNLMTILNFNSHLSDTAPLPLLLAVTILALALGIFFKNTLNADKRYIFLPISFLISPFIIEPLSYRFDSLTISASIFFAFAFISIETKNKIVSFLLKTGFIVSVFSFYQPSINIALTLMSVELFINMKFQKHASYILKSLVVKLFSLIIGSVIYMKVVLPLTHSGDNTSNHPGISDNIFARTLSNASAYYQFFCDNVVLNYGKALLLSSLIVSIALSMVICIKYYRVNKGKIDIIVSIIGIIATPLTFIASMITLLLLENPLVTFARVYIGINGLVLFIFTLIFLTLKSTRLSNYILFIPAMYIASFSFSYGNALRMQNVTNMHVVEVIKQALKETPDNSVKILFNGDAPKSPVLINSEKNYPLLKTIVLNYFYNWFGAYTYMKLNGVNQDYPDFSSKSTTSFISGYCNSEVIYSSSSIKIYKDADNVMVDFQKNTCN